VNHQTPQDSDLLDGLIEMLPELAGHHAPAGRFHNWLKPRVIEAIAARFGDASDKPCTFEPFGSLVFPYVRMGNIDSLDLFGLDELILFSFYWRNRKRYRKAVDFGANLGLHSLVLSRCGFDLRSFEPDPVHLELLRDRLGRNDCAAVNLHAAAVSTQAGEHAFTRVLGNTTGSHLSGAKPNPYGDLESITVPVEDALPHMAWADLVKMDIEGHEAEVLCATDEALWQGLDAVAEVGSPENAERIHAHFSKLAVNLFAQKTGWQRVQTLDDMPTSHRDGSLFISAAPEMPW